MTSLQQTLENAARQWLNAFWIDAVLHADRYRAALAGDGEALAALELWEQHNLETEPARRAELDERFNRAAAADDFRPFIALANVYAPPFTAADMQALLDMLEVKHG